MKTFKTGLVVGKFYPPHRGHKYLIDTAQAQCEQVTVIICWKKTDQISGYLRAQWLQRIHPAARVLVVEDTRLADDDSEGWAKFTIEILGRAPDAVFTSENYGDPYAKYLGCVHVLVDRERVHIPISARMVRSDPERYAQFLEPCVRGYFARRVAVVGAESTGKTTLAADLARHYKTAWVPEYGGRMYAVGKMYAKDEPWRTEEFTAIAHKQIELENSLAEVSNGLLICDTDALQTAVWHERYLGEASAEVDTIAAARPYPLYIVTSEETPFEQDGTRDGTDEVRRFMHRRIIERLKESKKKFVVVRGTPQERLEQAVKAINALSSR